MSTEENNSYKQNGKFKESYLCPGSGPFLFNGVAKALYNEK